MASSALSLRDYRVMVWFMGSHAVLALLIQRGMQASPDIPEIVWWLFAAVFGAAASLPLLGELFTVNRVLTRLLEQRSTGMQELSHIWLIPHLAQQMTVLMAQQSDMGSLRGQLIHQISEAAAQEERNRLARDLHDSIKQQIFSISVSAAAALAHWNTSAERASAALNDVRQSAQEAMVEMRAMLQQLSPAPLEKSGLLQALRDQCDALSYRSGAVVSIDVGAIPGNDRFTPGAQEALFRIAQEGLSNIARHARAQRVEVRLEQVDETVKLTIADDGQGFDPAHVTQGMGLDNIRKRIEIFQGQMQIDSAVGQGTRLWVTLPLLQPTQEDAIMHVTEKMFHQAVPVLYAVALGLAGFVYAISLVASAVLSPTREAPSIFVIGLGIFALVSLVLAGLYWKKGRDSLAYVMQHVSSTSVWAYRLARHRHQAVTLLFFCCAWFLPLIWVGKPIPAWVTAVVAVPFAALGTWHLAAAQWAHNSYLKLLQGEEREREILHRYQERFNGWLSFGALMGVLFLTGTWGDLMTISLMPETADQWMTTFFILASVILFFHLVYETWYYRAHLMKESAS